MVEFKEDSLMIDPCVMKSIGFYQMLSPHTPKLFGFNKFKYLTMAYLILHIVLLVIYILNVYLFLDDINELAKYILLISSGTASLFKLFSVIRHSDTLWKCIQFTSTDKLLYKYHDRKILESGRTKIKFLTSHFAFWWFVSVVVWNTAPLFINNYYIRVKVDDEISLYRYNVLNLVFPVSSEFYNGNFIKYYIIESSITMMLGHSILIYDVLTISMCITLRHQLKTIANSYHAFGITEKESVGKIYIEVNLYKYCTFVHIYWI